MRVYVTSLIAESMGVHLGKWFDLKAYPAPWDLEYGIREELTLFEWRIDEVDAPFPVNPRTSLEDLFEIQEYLDGPYGEAFELYAKYTGDVQYALDYFEDAYRGEWSSLRDYALDLYEDLYGDAAPPGYRIEPDMVAFRCDYVELEGANGAHVFWAA